ncbi:PREDICTED: uncharacterized protein LOC104756422 [Camelina sativa]|uniref:Uncharacterized protein LOC104756422 n=1 Tax=Camelina sativa TaxID=90675 RepID=A0ABM0WWV1_CAMSA|nr:PREDICTED: uncharacterized protein LOC104756422 [Camelina sativa]
MGIVAFNWAREGNNQLTLVMNRDNWGNRVISKASWDGHILSGRYEDSKGTWFAISKRGRVAFLMSRTLLDDDIVPFRGSEFYPSAFLESNMSPWEFAVNVQRERDIQNKLSYSLIVADMASNSMVHIRKPEKDEPNVMIGILPSGVHTLSPLHGLDSEIAVRDTFLRDRFTQMIGHLGNDPLPQLNEFASNYMLSPVGEGQETVFVEEMANHPDLDRALGMQRYGTTSTTALVVIRTGEVKIFERYREENGQLTENNLPDFTFQDN